MRTLLLIILLAILPVTGIQADAVNLYQGEAVVENNDAGERRRALPSALANVLRKYSGLRSFEEYPQVEPALGIASSIVVSFHYRSAGIVLADGTEAEELRLVANFSGPEVDKLATNLQLPLWQPRRDPIDLWVVVDNGVDRRIMPVEFDYAWNVMGEVAASRGLPVEWPTADEEGMFLVDAQVLWGGYTEDLGIVPGRGVMIMAARREGLEWSVRSNLAYRGQNWTWRSQNIDLQAALVESTHQAADQVAMASTIAASDLGTWLLEIAVSGMKNADEYIRCLDYLQQLSVVSQVAVVSAKPGNVSFRIELNALPQYFEDAILGGQFLELAEDRGSYVLVQ